jgi:hypothetical protein
MGYLQKLCNVSEVSFQHLKKKVINDDRNVRTLMNYKIQIVVFWVITPCSFGSLIPPFQRSDLKMKAVCSLKTLGFWDRWEYNNSMAGRLEPARDMHTHLMELLNCH